MINVLVVDDSAYNRMSLTRMLTHHPDINVTDTARNGEEAIKKIHAEPPDVITLDLEMPVMDGFAVLRWLKENNPLPVIVVSARASDNNVFKALELGAVDFIAKPSGKASPTLNQIGNDLVAKVIAAARARLKNAPPPKHPDLKVVEEPKERSAFQCLVIGASTGGPQALQSIISALPVLPFPIVIAQHMPPVFTQLFAERLDRISPMKVTEGKDNQLLDPGTIAVGPGGSHVALAENDGKIFLHLLPRMMDDLYAPRVDVLFHSAANVFGSRTLAVLLTGMGSDGAKGLKEIRDAGGTTLVESQESAVVFGMPGEAVRLDAADHVLPHWEIPGRILELL